MVRNEPKQKASRAPSRYLEHDALAYDPKRLKSDEQARANTNYVAKRAKKGSGEEVVFDPAGHREWQTGFHKRKVQRRNKAIKEQLTKARKEHLEVKAKKREELKHRLGLGDNWGVEDSGDEAKDKDEERNLLAQITYDNAHGGVTTTVTTVALDSGSEDASEDDGDGDADSDDDNGDRQASQVGAKAFSSGSRGGRNGTGSSQKAMSLNKKVIDKASASLKKKKKKGDSTKGKTKSFKKHMKAAKKGSDGEKRGKKK